MTASDFFSNFTWTEIVAGLALALGIVNFYWMHLRVKKALYFLRIGRVGDMSPQFALINGGNRDLLLVEIFCQFNEKTPGQSFPPAAASPDR